jgi:DNA-binding transcriptional ArsR family regulator
LNRTCEQWSHITVERRNFGLVTGVPERFIDWDVLFRTLSHPRRRQLLDLLRERGAMGVTELAAALAGHPDSDVRDGQGPRQRTRVRTRLVHGHLPQLDGAGLVDWDRSGSVVAITERGRSLPDRVSPATWTDGPERLGSDPRRPRGRSG